MWGELEHSIVLRVLRSPRYAGAFCFGRTRQRKLPSGSVRSDRLPRDEWIALIRDAHDGYITWDDYEENQRRLAESRRGGANGARRAPPREGPALLQGLVICGRCGKRMTVRYRDQRGKPVPVYCCQRDGIVRSEAICQLVPGAAVDAQVGALLVDVINPIAIEVALSVCDEVHARIEEADRLRARQVERARYEADLARSRYMQVDPNNRLVADVLEADWNAKLRALTDAQADYEARRAKDRAGLDDEKRGAVQRLAVDFPTIWNDPRTSHRDRKRILRLLVEDVTLLKNDEVHLHVRFRGGTTRSLVLPKPRPAWALRQSSPELIAKIDRLLDEHTLGEIPALLNARLPLGRGQTDHAVDRPPSLRQLRAATPVRPTAGRRPADRGGARETARRERQHGQELAPRRLPLRAPV